MADSDHIKKPTIPTTRNNWLFFILKSNRLSVRSISIQTGGSQDCGPSSQSPDTSHERSSLECYRKSGTRQLVIRKSFLDEMGSHSRAQMALLRQPSHH